jgi:glucan phosphoethanolaminetransferase (alkaline phosphatase superfamily)
MQVYGYERPTTPFLTSLLKTGRLKKVEMATSSCADTNCGISTIITSKPLEKYIQQSFKLHELLYDQGYKVYFVLSGSHRRWYGLDDAYGNSFNYFFDGTKSSKYNWNDDRVIFEGLEKAPDLGSAPGFFYFHLMSTHLVGVRQEQYSKYQPARVWTSYGEGYADTVSTTNHYDNGVLQADAIIKGIFESLEHKGYLANSVVAIIADHGEGLGPPDHGNLRSRQISLPGVYSHSFPDL